MAGGAEGDPEAVSNEGAVGDFSRDDPSVCEPACDEAMGDERGDCPFPCPWEVDCLELHPRRIPPKKTPMRRIIKFIYNFFIIYSIFNIMYFGIKYKVSCAG